MSHTSALFSFANFNIYWIFSPSALIIWLSAASSIAIDAKIASSA
jgi:hypothetical protein